MNSACLPPSPLPTAVTLRGATDDALVAALSTNAVTAATAVGEMQRRFARQLRALATSLVGASDADDVVQDVFVVVLTEARFHPAPSRLLAWLSGITRRVANARRVQLHMERLEPADAMIADPWIEEIDGPAPPRNGRRKRRARRGEA
jgi:DNA-directed RNA polymerase specialized sigma24 family protein